jgi:hypothetical protein
MTDEERDYDVYRTDFKYLRIVCRIVLVLLAIVALLLIFSCKQTDYSDEECCWFCAVSVTYYYPGNNPYEVTSIGRYQYCDRPDSIIRLWEMQNTYQDTTENGVVFIQIAKCRK